MIREKSKRMPPLKSTSLKKFLCSICQKDFTTKEHRDGHMLVVHQVSFDGQIR